jgi:hypothetical protein
MMSALTGFGLARRGHVHRWGGAFSVVVGRLRRMCKAMACSVLP